MKSKKADVWVSAVLYFGLGIIVISLLLAAGLPAINKLRDKNVVIQSKGVFQVIDKNIRDVVRGGPGSQRVVNVDIKKGDFKIDDSKEEITWEYSTKIAISEPGSSPPGSASGSAIPVSEGNIKIATWKEGDGYKVRMWLLYSDPDPAKSIVVFNSGEVNTISGLTDLSIRNDGLSPSTNKVQVSISEIK